MGTVRSFEYAVLLALGFSLAASLDLTAQGKGGGKGGGGGGGQPVAGSVYFTFQNLTWSMDADGNNKTSLTAGVGGEPSYDLHGGQRWFLTVQNGELFAIAEDTTIAGPLTDPDDDFVLFGKARWAKDDPGTSVDERDSYVGYMAFDSNARESIFRLSISWPSSVPFSGPAPVEVLSEADIPAGTDLAHFDFAPDGVNLVYQVNTTGLGWAVGNQFLRVKDVLSGASRPLTNKFYRRPEWSPDGTKIAFESNGTVETINPDGTGQKVIARDSGGRNAMSVEAPRWSPTGSHMVYRRSPNSTYKSSLESQILRTSKDGGATTNLTAGLETSIFQMVAPVAWR